MERSGASRLWVAVWPWGLSAAAVCAARRGEGYRLTRATALPSADRPLWVGAPLRCIDQRTFDPPFMPAWHHKCSSDSFGDFFIAFGASSYVSNTLKPVIRDMTFLRLE